MFEGSKVNLSSTKYEINDLKLHFLSTNDLNSKCEQTMMDGLGNKKQPPFARRLLM